MLFQISVLEKYKIIKKNKKNGFPSKLITKFI